MNENLPQPENAPIYMDVLTDFGFKKTFMNPKNKSVLIKFINRVLERTGESEIIDLVYLPTEHVGLDVDHKKVVQDLECCTQDGRHFIVEMQRAVESDFRERIGFYAFRASIDDLKAGERYALKPVYIIVISEEEVHKGFNNILQMATIRFEEGNERFLRYPIFLILELSKLPRTHERSMLYQWLYALANLGQWSQPPQDTALMDEVHPLLEAAKIAILNTVEQKQYHQSLDEKRGMKYAFEYKMQQGLEQGLAKGREEGRQEGRQEGLDEGIEKAKREVVQGMLDLGLPWDTITKVTGFSEADWIAKHP